MLNLKLSISQTKKSGLASYCGALIQESLAKPVSVSSSPSHDFSLMNTQFSYLFYVGFLSSHK